MVFTDDGEKLLTSVIALASVCTSIPVTTVMASERTSKNDVNIELYTYIKDLSMEQKLEDVLDKDASSMKSPKHGLTAKSCMRFYINYCEP